MQTRKQIIQELREKAVSYKKIGELLGISRQRVHQILTGYISPFAKRLEEEQKKRAAEAQKRVNALIVKIIHKKIPKGVSLSSITGIHQGSRDQLRELIRIRDNHTCQLCNKKWKKGKRRFDVHHNGDDIDGKTPDMTVDNLDRKNIDRMITLCHKCHLNLYMTTKKMREGKKKKKLST